MKKDIRELEQMDDWELKNKLHDMLSERREFIDNLQDTSNIVRAAELRKELDALPEKFAFSTGFPGLDALVEFVEAGELVVISGHTGTGKTTLLQTLTESIAEQGIMSVWFSYEIGARKLFERFQSLPDFCVPRTIKESSVEWLFSSILQAKEKYGIRVAFVDHLHYLLDMGTLSKGNSSLMIGGVLRELKKFCVAQDITIFLVSHIRKVSTSVEPELSDLRDSSFTAQESDMVWMLYRATEKSVYTTTESTYLHVFKNRRAGNLGKIKLEFAKKRYYEAE